MCSFDGCLGHRAVLWRSYFETPAPPELMRNSTPNASGLCPLLGTPGEANRTLTGLGLLELYAHWFKAVPPAEFHERLFSEAVVEYQSAESGLRWYSPHVMADGPFYAWLGSAFRWYYQAETWDKKRALAYLKAAGVRSFVEVGCGNGAFIKSAAHVGIDGTGIDLSEEVVAQARAQGLKIFTPDEALSITGPVEALCLVQTLEHLPDPLAEMRRLVERYRPRLLVLSVPCWDSILGPSSDPLSWPPHHATSWSGKALTTLGELLGARTTDVSYEPLSFDEFCSCFTHESADRLGGVPFKIQGRPSEARVRSLLAKWWLGRIFRRPWAMRGHSVMAAMKFESLPQA